VETDFSRCNEAVFETIRGLDARVSMRNVRVQRSKSSRAEISGEGFERGDVYADRRMLRVSPRMGHATRTNGSLQRGEMKYGKSKRGSYRRSELGQFYVNRNPACEICGHTTEELHHIISRKTGGLEEEWNYLALCRYCHNGFHSIGRYSFAVRYPSVYDKIKTACENMGRVFDKGE
jgi:5-methylcytosine-specific restriction endonuclease McrA